MVATRVAQSRHGFFTYHSEDRFLGTSLRIYGEYSEGEVHVYDSLLRPTDIAVEVGANIGALTVPLARRCKQVFAFEPQPQTYDLLCKNLIDNDIINVVTFPFAISDRDGHAPMPSVDQIDLNFGRVEVGEGNLTVELHPLDKVLTGVAVTFMKLDCEGMELEVLKGAETLIKTNQPVLYVENDRPEKSKALIDWIFKQGYHGFWHRPPLYREDNFRNYADNIFGVSDSKNMLCYPANYKGPVVDWLTEPVA